MELIPLNGIDANTVSVAFLTEWCLRYGFPRTILSDRGGQFVGDVGMWLAKVTGMKRTPTTSYRPQTDGITERPHADIEKQMAMAAIDEFGVNDWDKVSEKWPGLLRAIAFNHNTLKHRAFGMKYSPIELALTKRGNVPSDECVEYWMRSITDGSEYEFSAKSGKDAIDSANILKQLAMIRSEKATEKQRKYDIGKRTQLEREREQPTDYVDGEPILLRIRERTKWRGKIGPRWATGWSVKKKINSNVYVIMRLMKGKFEERTVNVADLAKFFE
jgi:hypothetical protein